MTKISDSDIREYTEMVWSAFLQMEVTPLPTPPLLENDPTIVAGAVQINGAWKGLVGLYMEQTMATRVAEVIFHLNPGEATTDIIQDAVGELINMLGGNIKALLPQPSNLSLPLVALEGHVLHFPNTKVTHCLSFKCPAGHFKVVLMEKKETQIWKDRLQELKNKPDSIK